MKAFVRSLGILAFLTLASPVAALEWYQAYSKGEEAVNKGNCVEGKKLIEEALRKNPKSELKSRPYGTFRMEYIPYFYLAKCAVNQEDAESARKYIKQAEQTSVYASAKSAEFTQIKAEFDKKFATPETVKPPVTTTPAPTTVKPAPASTTPPPTTTTPPVNQRNLFVEYSREANDALRRGDYSRARELANLMDQLQRNNLESRRILTEIERREQRQTEDSSRQQEIQKAQLALKNGSSAAAENLIFDLKLRYPNDPQVTALARELDKRKEAELKNLGETQLIRALEKQVVLAFYKGYYESVIQLSEQSLEKNPNNWKVNFFVGCSYAALSLLETADRDNRLNMAKQAFRKARVAPDQRISGLPYISPKILDIYNKT